MEEFDGVSAPESEAVQVQTERGFMARRRLGILAGTALLSVVAGCTPVEHATPDASDPSVSVEATPSHPSVSAQATQNPVVIGSRPPSSAPKERAGYHGLYQKPGQRIGEVKAVSPEVRAEHPNVVFILLDDAQLELLPYMKKTNDLIFKKGAVFKNYYDNMSLCCPARATLLRSQYAHNTGVKSNTEPNGGFQKFLYSGDEKSTVATWIHNIHSKDGKSIYDTALVGKYMNSFPYNFSHKREHYVADSYTPPGWSYFATPVKGNPYKGTFYKLAINGVVDKHYRSMKKNPKNYLSDTIAALSTDYIRAHQNKKPYFLYESFYSPHSPSTPAPRYKHMKIPKGPRPESSPAFNEADMSDKPSFARVLPKISPNVKRQIDKNFDNRVRAVQAIDDTVAEQVQAVKDAGQEDNTVFIVTTDNAFHEGQHRMPMGKNTPYDTDIHLFLAMAGKINGQEIQHRTIKKLVGDQMMGATFADLTGAKPDYELDGPSMLPLALGKQPKHWPKAVLTERFNSQGYSSTADGLSEPADTPAEAGRTSTTPYEGVRTERFLYVIYNYGHDKKRHPTEFYDMKKDPNQLHNLSSEKHLSPFYRKNERQLRKDIARLAVCKGVTCQR